MGNDDTKLYNKSEKLKCVVNLLKLKTKNIAERLEIQDSFVSKLFDDKNNKLKKIHLFAFSNAYNIPMEIFELDEINTKEKVQEILDRNKNNKTIFKKNNKLIKKLVGDWYLYSYPSNLKHAEVWETKTTFYNDGSVIDEHENKGFLHIGQNQSIILKESAGSKNITSITFDNYQVEYKVFPFSRVSKSNGVNRELFNFGIFSKNKIDIEVVKVILGERQEVQIKINYGLLERVNSFIEVG